MSTVPWTAVLEGKVDIDYDGEIDILPPLK